ncbi:hypothetical protein CCHR01_10400 [Colletotrichum chrysophilum]|uniref:Uncharacterized protein n=1 Tax=Colletotrichum chrysophilum TaxID=1836956 RepID=A0AAD9EGS9_9PEZI|nr:hypothetical protein CCHR01_10400 [Colletotrichum chrysophilum]
MAPGSQNFSKFKTAHNWVCEDNVVPLRMQSSFSLLLRTLRLDFPALPVNSLISGIKSAIAPSRPLWRRLTHVIFWLPVPIGPALLKQLKEPLVVNPRVPLAVFVESVARKQHAAAVRMLRRDAILKPLLIEPLLQGRHEFRNFPVERHVGHAQAGVGCRGGAAVRDALDLHEARQPLLDELRVPLNLVVDVEALDERKAEDGAMLEALLA